MFSGQKCLKSPEVVPGPRKRVLVIGAGAAGLVALKTALESGHDAVALERLSDIGGLWNFKLCGTTAGYADIADPDVHCYPTYDSLVTNTSEFMTMFSDFMPIRERSKDFIRHDELCEYIKAYAEHFNLLDKIHLNCHVERLDKKKGGKWEVSYKKDGENRSSEFDFVMICTGAFGFPHHENIKGKEDFAGTMVHSGQVRNGEPLFRDKRALVVGAAYSGGEMMCMALKSGVKKLYVCATHRPKRRSVWSIDRYTKSIYGDFRPWDHLMNRENMLDHDDFGSMLGSWCYPFHKKTSDATLTYPGDALALTYVKDVDQAINSGIIAFVGPIASFGTNEAKLEDGSSIKDLDVTVCATGYDQQFPFLDHIWPREDQKKLALYNYIVSPKPELDGIGFIILTPSGFPLLPCGEIQARWFTHRIISRAYDDSGSIFSATERQQMREAIDTKRTMRPPFVRFNYIDNMAFYNDYLARDIGAQPPDYKKLIETGDQEKIDLGVALAYGPLHGVQYRIQGPHAWPEAERQCVVIAKRVLGEHFEEYAAKVKQNDYPKSGILDPTKGPYNVY